tara:strand:- start:1279 stop:1776 length:498 start_codon:yes stop_codon:yes gene_type:complete
MAKKNTSIIILGVIFTILVIIDLFSTLRFGELIQYLEANPVYQHIGIIGIILLNIIFLIAICAWYFKTKNITSRFYVIHILVLMNLTRLLVIWNNFKVHKELSLLSKEKAIEMAMAVTPQMKMEHITGIAALQILPLFVGILTYWLFCIDHKIDFKEELDRSGQE